MEHDEQVDQGEAGDLSTLNLHLLKLLQQDSTAPILDVEQSLSSMTQVQMENKTE